MPNGTLERHEKLISFFVSFPKCIAGKGIESIMRKKNVQLADTPCKKNEEYEVVIEDLGAEGEGIAKLDGYALFVKDALPGERCRVLITKANKNFAYARLLEVLDASPYRIEPVCSVAKACGGCKIMALSYEQQLQFKERKVKHNLETIGKVTDFEYAPIIGMEEPYAYRNKAQFPLGMNKEGKIISGFYAGRTHHIVENDGCAIGVAENQEILDIVKAFMEEHHISAYDENTGKGLVRHVMIRKAFSTGEVMVCLVVNGTKLPKEDKLVEALQQVTGMISISVNVNQERTNVILGAEVRVLYGRDYIVDFIGDLQFRISPKSFFQVNPVQTERLYGKALEFAGLNGTETVWDLYCGIGTISLFLAKKAKKVYGVEIVPEAIRDAKVNAEVNQIENSEFFVGKSEEVLPAFYKEHGGYADVIVVDPPRKGCDEALLQTIVEMAPEKVVYVSCDSATLGRDVRYLTERGYVLRKAQAVDMFPHSCHVETCVLLSKVNS